MLFRSYLPVIVRILLGTCDCLPCGFFSAGTFISLSVSFHGLKAWTWLLGSSIACRVVMTTCLWGQLARMGLVVILILPVRFFLQNLEAVDYPSFPCCWSTCQLLNSLPAIHTLLTSAVPQSVLSVQFLSPLPLSPAVTDYAHLRSSKNQESIF